MRNCEAWKESKYVLKRGLLVASPDPGEVSVSSRLIASLVAGRYQKALEARACGRLLDLGCGKAPLYCIYGSRSSDVTCVDWENSLHGNPYIDMPLDLSSQPLPFEDGRFDTIILSDVLEHIPTPERLWGEMTRVLAEGGRIFMNVPFYYPLHERPHDYYRYTEYALRRFVDLSGLNLVEVTPIGGIPEIIADIVSKAVNRGPGAILAAAIQGLTFWFVRTGFGKRISNATAQGFPYGYFLVAEKPSGARSA